MHNNPHPKEEKTFVMIKPDGVEKGLIGEIIARFERRDLKVVFLEMAQLTPKLVDGHYPKDKAWINRLGEKTLATYEKYSIDPLKEMGTKDTLQIGKQVRSWLLEFMAEAPVVLVVVQGIHAVDVVRKIAGATMPSLAAIGTIRGDYSIDSPLLANKERRSIRNLVHASETPEEALHEISYWLGKKKIFSYKRFGVDA